jgi:hypothetical protein
MTFNLGKLHLGERVRLKPGVQEVRFTEECAKVPRSTGSGASATMTNGDPSSCWHDPCRIVLAFQDGGFLIENSYGSVRQADPDMLLKDYS